MGDETDIFSAGGITDRTTPTQNSPPNLVADYNLGQSGILDPTGRVIALYRGYLKSISGSKPSMYFGFHYNPTEINFAYDFDESQLTPIQVDSASVGIPRLVGGASVSFTMRLDRTRELAAISQGPDSPGNLGVIHDMRVLQKLVGGLDATNKDGSKNTGQMNSIPVTVAFSNQLGNAVNPTDSELTSTGLNFRGWITSFQVTFTQFNYLMVPSRANVDVTIRKVFDPSPDTSPGSDLPAGSPVNGLPGSGPGFSSGGLGRTYTQGPLPGSGSGFASGGVGHG